MIARDPVGAADARGAAPAPDLRLRILDAAARLIVEGGVSALTTRAVAAAAGVQAPALYRLFGDKRGLLDAVAEHRFAAYVAGKGHLASPDDPVEALRESWDAHVAFGLANPAVFAIINEVGRVGPPSTTAEAGVELLRAQVHAIARAGRLRTSEPRAVSLVKAAASGTVTTLLEQPEPQRDAGLSATARDAVIAALTREGARMADEGAASHAIALRAHLPTLGELTPGERLLLGELLDRVAG